MSGEMFAGVRFLGSRTEWGNIDMAMMVVTQGDCGSGEKKPLSCGGESSMVY